MSNNEFYKLECVACKKTCDETKHYTSCPHCGDSLDIVYDYNLIGERLNVHLLKLAPIKSIKYLDFYPLRDLKKVVSLDEGGTPLYHCKNLGKALGMKKLYLKNEGANPTGAFKDRGTMVEITKALELGKKTVCCASTGNMAASVAAYSSIANLPCYILVPEGTPIGKLSQTLSYGARIIQIRGSYDEAAKITEEIGRQPNFYLAGDYAFRLEGQKSTGFEIAEQLNWRSPDHVIVPVGCGTHASAIYKGFKEFAHFDLIENTPSMIAVQAEGASPIIDAFNKGKKKWDIITNPQTVASAMCVGNPLDGTKILHALRESKGKAVAVKDDPILEAEKLLAKTESVFVEPSAAATLAGLQDMLHAGTVDPSDEVVMVMTGTGLKDPISALKVLPSPPSVEPYYNDVMAFLNYGYFNVYAHSQSSTDIIFKSLPGNEQLKQVLKKNFDVQLTPEHLASCMDMLTAFFEKGKVVTASDLRLILEDVFKRPNIRKRVLEVVDFHVEIGKHIKPFGTIKVKYLGRKITKKAYGVGPVDAIINAIKETVASTELDVKLVDYMVDIKSKGSDAVVDVKMALKDDQNNKIIAMGAGPDIVEASVRAFEDGYNLLYMRNKHGKRG